MKHDVLISKIQNIWEEYSPYWQAKEANKYYNNTICCLKQMVSYSEAAMLQMKKESNEIVEIAQSLLCDM